MEPFLGSYDALHGYSGPFFSFWFGFIRPNKRQLELGLEKNVWQNIKEDFNMYLGRIFEDICIEVTAEMARKGLLPLQVGKIGKWWWKETEIAIVGLKGEKLLAIEAKWKELTYQEAKKLLSQLNIKASQIPKVKELNLGIMAKKIEDKEKIRGEEFIVLDLQDIEKICKQD